MRGQKAQQNSPTKTSLLGTITYPTLAKSENHRLQQFWAKVTGICDITWSFPAKNNLENGGCSKMNQKMRPFYKPQVQTGGQIASWGFGAQGVGIVDGQVVFRCMKGVSVYPKRNLQFCKWKKEEWNQVLLGMELLGVVVSYSWGGSFRNGWKNPTKDQLFIFGPYETQQLNHTKRKKRVQQT